METGSDWQEAADVGQRWATKGRAWMRSLGKLVWVGAAGTGQPWVSPPPWQGPGLPAWGGE